MNIIKQTAKYLIQNNLQEKDDDEKENFDKDVNVWAKLIKKIINNIEVMFVNVNLKLSL